MVEGGSLTPAILFATTKYVYDFKYVFDVTLISVCSLLFLERTGQCIQYVFDVTLISVCSLLFLERTGQCILCNVRESKPTRIAQALSGTRASNPRSLPLLPPRAPREAPGRGGRASLSHGSATGTKPPCAKAGIVVQSLPTCSSSSRACTPSGGAGGEQKRLPGKAPGAPRALRPALRSRAGWAQRVHRPVLIGRAAPPAPY